MFSLHRAAAIRCYVELCLRDGGLTHLPRAVAMLAPLLPAATAGIAPTHGCASTEYDDLQFGTQQLLLRRVALQGLIDLAQTWGEPTLTAELQTAAAAGHGRVRDITARFAIIGVDDGGTQAAAPAALTAVGREVPGVVPILLRLTEGVVRKFQVPFCSLGGGRWVPFTWWLSQQCWLCKQLLP